MTWKLMIDKDLVRLMNIKKENVCGHVFHYMSFVFEEKSDFKLKNGKLYKRITK